MTAIEVTATAIATPTKKSKGVSREEAFANILLDEAFLDIKLQGTDGMNIPANRMSLAVRSPVLRAMLYGGFAESSSGTVEMGYEGWILRAIVQWIHTDTVAILEFDKIDFGTAAFYQHFENLVYLVEAAACYDLQGRFLGKGSCQGASVGLASPQCLPLSRTSYASRHCDARDRHFTNHD